MFAIILLTIIIFGTLMWFPYYKWRDRDIPSLKGASPLPFIGTLKNFINCTNIFEKLKDHFDIYGKTIRGYLLTEQSIFTIDKEFIEFITTSNATINKSRVYDYLHNWLGTGLLTSANKKWRQRRKMITPAYHFKVLDQFMEIFDRNSNIMVKKLQPEVEKPQTDIFPFVNLCALDTICETSMGTQVNAQTSDESEFVRATKYMNRIIMERAFSLVKQFDATYAFTKDCQIEKDALKVLHGYTLSVIRSRREELIKDNEKGKENRRDNFLDILLKSSIDGAPLSDEDIREEVDTFTFEGHDTVSSGMSFAFYAISNHPEVQQRLLEEQRAIFGNNPFRPTTLNDLTEMKYLDMVIKETMRLYPPVPLMGREFTEEVKYKDLTLRKGVQVLIFTYELHRDPDTFPDPLKFDPERFLPEEQIKRHPFSYIPFSAGYRNCIGQKFAMLEMKSTISKVLRNYELFPLVPRHEPAILSETILRSENGILMRLQKRIW